VKEEKLGLRKGLLEAQRSEEWSRGVVQLVIEAGMPTILRGLVNLEDLQEVQEIILFAKM